MFRSHSARGVLYYAYTEIHMPYTYKKSIYRRAAGPPRPVLVPLFQRGDRRRSTKATMCYNDLNYRLSNVPRERVYTFDRIYRKQLEPPGEDDLHLPVR